MNRQETIDIKPLHELLKHRTEDDKPLRVTVTSDSEDETTIRAKGDTITLRHRPYVKLEPAVRSMLRHYPVPALVNGEEVPRTPFRQIVYLNRHQQEGNLMERNIRIIQVHPPVSDENPESYVPSAAFSQGLTYKLNLPEAKKTCVLPAETWNDKRNNIRPAEVWQASHHVQIPEAEAPETRYELTYGAIPTCYHTSYETLQDIQAQTADANNIIRRILPSAPIPDWQNGGNPHHIKTGERIFHIWAPESNGATAYLSNHMLAAAPDNSENGQGICFSLTRALLQNPDAGILPALPQNEARATILCEKAVIKWSDGLEIVLKGDDLTDDELATFRKRCSCPAPEQCPTADQPCAPQEPFSPRRALPDSINMTLNLKYPGQPDRVMDLPADILCAGVIYDNHTWVTRKDWPQDVLNQAIRHTAEIEFNAIWNINDQVTYNYIEDDFRAHRLAWWTRVFHGEQTGFNHELDRLAGQFYPQSNHPSHNAHSHNGSHGSSLTWRPAGTWDWLDSIIKAQYSGTPDATELKLITEAAQRTLVNNQKAEIETAVAEAIRQCPAQEPA